MTTISCTIPDALGKKLARAAKQRRVPKATLVREGLTAVLAQPPTPPGQPLTSSGQEPARPFVSALDVMGNLRGIVRSGLGDLSTNKKHLAGLGREKFRP